MVEAAGYHKAYDEVRNLDLEFWKTHWAHVLTVSSKSQKEGEVKGERLRGMNILHGAALSLSFSFCLLLSRVYMPSGKNIKENKNEFNLKQIKKPTLVYTVKR